MAEDNEVKKEAEGDSGGLPPFWALGLFTIFVYFSCHACELACEQRPEPRRLIDDSHFRYP